MSTQAASSPAIFAAVATELELARSHSMSLDSVLGRLLEVAPADQRGTVLSQMQTVDLLNQQLEAVHGFLGRMAAAGSQDPMLIDGALRTITLGEVAKRLRAALLEPTAVEEPADDGDLDLF